MQKRLVPVREPKGGALRDSIRYKMGGGLLDDQELSVTIMAGNDKAWYARLIEYGAPAAVAGGRFKGAQIPARPAIPFFFPAYRALRKRVKSRLQRATSKAAKKVAAQ